MRIHRLTMRGIGPFVEEYSIDFDAFAERKLFLIEGVTGAGKSTIIDAIVFALYGSVTEGMSEERLVSDFLGEFKPADRPFVELVFSVESGVFRIRREPRNFFRNKKGELSQRNATARLERLANEKAGDGSLISTAIAEVGGEVVARVQLDRKQFHSTVVLAQGRFAKFLQATSEEREAILERVFATSGYARAQRVLEELRKQARAKREGAVGTLRDAASRFVEAAGIADEDGTWVGEAEAEPHAAVAHAGERVAVLAAAASEARARQVSAAAALEAANAAAGEAERRAKLVKDKRTVLANVAAAEAREPRIAQYRDDLDRHRRAMAVAPAIESLEAAATDDATAAKVFEQAFAELADESLAALPDESLAEALRAAAGEVEAELARLEEPAALERQLPLLERAVATAEDAKAAAQAELAACEARRDALPAEIAELDSAIRQLALIADRKADLASDVEEYLACKAAAQKWADLLEQLEAANEEVASAQRELDEASAAVAEAERGYNASIAVQVAVTLKPNEPCPACGSVEHPNPASSVDAVDFAAVKTARKHEADARNELDGARKSQGGITVAVAGEEASAKGRDAEYWNTKVEAAREALKKAKDAERDLGRRQKLRDGLVDQQAQIDAAYAAAVAALSEAKAHAKQARKDVSTALVAVADARGDYPSLGERVADLNGRRRSLAAVEGAHKTRAEAVAAHRSARKGLKAALAANGFDNRVECEGSLLPKSERQQREAEVDDHDGKVRRAEEWLNHPAHAGVDADEVVDTDGPAAAREAANAAHVEATGLAATADRAHASAAKRFKELDKAVRSVEEVWASTAPVMHVAAVAKGDNKLGIPLASYVVLRRFQEVVRAANERLQVISDGRYRLEADTTVRDGRNRARGLGLRIIDEDTEKSRDVGTLSGGETFYTSLALALGLADVVQEESGGIRLETLFIDEGFGSLDDDTLNKVMDVLNQLTRGDRVVGVISHVEEMKRAIPDQVKVRRRSDGSSVIEMPT